MSRGIEFDYEKAIDRATRLFWKKGYSNTSTRELQKVMRIGYGSFYNTVKSKKKLYLECLKHYRATVVRQRETALFSQPSAKLGVRAFFKIVLDQMDDPKRPGLCLMAGSMSRDVLDEKELREYLMGGSDFLRSAKDRTAGRSSFERIGPLIATQEYGRAHLRAIR